MPEHRHRDAAPQRHRSPLVSPPPALMSSFTVIGFVPIERYRADELVDTRFHELALDASSLPRL